MKKLIPLLLTLALCLCLCACKSNSADSKPSVSESISSGKFELSGDGKIIITDEFLECEPTEAVLDKLDSLLLWHMNSASSARVEASMVGWEDEIKFSSYEVTSTEFIDNCTVEVRGNLYGKTPDGDSAESTFTVEAYFKEDTEADCGFSVCFDSWGLASKYTIK